MTKILLLSGSARRESLNRKLIRSCAERLAPHCEIDVLDPEEVDLPLFDQDLEAERDVLMRVVKVYQRFACADGFVFASPEYNASVSPFFKNTIDWVSRFPFMNSRFPNTLLNRPVLLGSAGTGWSGGAFGMSHARAIIVYLGGVVLSEQIALPYAQRYWTGESEQFPEDVAAEIDGALMHLVALARQPRFESCA